MDVLVLKVGPQVKPMPDLDIFVGAMMGKNTVLELPEPCRSDLSGFSKNVSNICLHKLLKMAEAGRGKRSRADTLGKWRHAPN